LGFDGGLLFAFSIMTDLLIVASSSLFKDPSFHMNQRQNRCNKNDQTDGKKSQMGFKNLYLPDSETDLKQLRTALMAQTKPPSCTTLLSKQ